VTPAKILLCHNHYAEPGGESLVFDNLVRGLRDRGHSVVTYLRNNATIGTTSALGKIRLVGSSYRSSQTAHEIARLVATEKPQVAIVQNVLPLMTPSVYTALRRARVPIIQATYNYRFVCPAGELYSRGEICERCLGGNYVHCAVRRCYRNSRSQSAWYASIIGWHRFRGTFELIDRFQVPDTFMADKLAAGGLPREKMFVNVNPFFAEEFAPTTTHRGYIAYVGRLVRQKGVLTLLEAARISAGMHVVIGGRGELEQELRDFVRRHALEDRVKFVGPLWGDELRQMLAGACAVAVPSEWYDNLPLVLCQANASGKPVIASRINGIPEYVQNGVNGFLFEPGRAAELATRANQLLNLDQEAYALLARQTRTFAEERLDFAAYYRVLSSEIERFSEERNRQSSP
jgi:glycosyltransferase involved in cell wall biosynthesis